MSLTIQYDTDQQIPASLLLDLVVTGMGAELFQPPDGTAAFARTPAMDIVCSALPEKAEDANQEDLEQTHASGVGFRRRSTVSFRLIGRASVEHRDAAWAQILNFAIDLSQRFPGQAALVMNYEQILMRATGSNGVVFDTWEGFAEDPALAAIVSRWPQETLEQPML